MSNEIIYAQNMDNDWVHTSDEDDYAEDDEETVTMTLEDDQFEEVSKFKKLIVKEPEFMGIYRLSDYQILHIFKTLRPLKSERTTDNLQCVWAYPNQPCDGYLARAATKIDFSKTQLELIRDLYIELFGCEAENLEIYQQIGKKMYNLLYTW